MAELPDKKFYQPIFQPWLGYGDFFALYTSIRNFTLVSPDRCWMLRTLAYQAISLPGEFWECGVYKGGTAMLLAQLIAENPGEPATLRLFDTFSGMPETHPEFDRHEQGDFSDVEIDDVRRRVSHEFAHLHKGLIPNSFAGLENTKIALAHVDVDIYGSVLDCCSFIYPRMVSGGFMIFDDYGFPTCPGARRAVDEFFATQPEVPMVLPTGQAIVFIAPRP